jgi:hypothetical protein
MIFPLLFDLVKNASSDAHHLLAHGANSMRKD